MILSTATYSHYYNGYKIICDPGKGSFKIETLPVLPFFSMESAMQHIDNLKSSDNVNKKETRKKVSVSQFDNW